MTPDTLKLPTPRRQRFSLNAESRIELPAFPGSTWRGLLGHGLRSVACVTRTPSCDSCSLIDSCVHGRFFESRNTRNPKGRHTVYPHPFVLETVLLSGTARTVDAGSETGFGLTLLGEADITLFYLVEAVKRAGRLGIGRNRGRFTLRKIEEETTLGSNLWQTRWQEGAESGLSPCIPAIRIPAVPAAVEIELQTPLRLKQRGRLVGPRKFSAELFLTALWRRAHELADFHGKAHHTFELPMPTQRPEGAHATGSRLRWYDWQRYSSRQKTAMRLGGLLGSWQLEGIALETWWPLLWYGQWVHLGKATSMGLGRYRLRELQS